MYFDGGKTDQNVGFFNLANDALATYPIGLATDEQ